MDDINNLSKEIAAMADTQTVKGLSKDALADMNSALDDLEDLDLMGAIDDATAGVILEEDPGELDDDLLDSVDARIERQESYEQQESVALSTVDPADMKQPQKVRISRASKKGTPRVTTPKVERDLSKIPEEYFMLEGDMNDATHPAGLRDAAILRMPTQKKVAEKFENIFISLAAGKLPSVYVVQGIEILKNKGSLTSGDFVTALTADEYNIGTARAQAGQIINLFHTLKILQPGGTLNPNSTIYQRITKLAGL